MPSVSMFTDYLGQEVHEDDIVVYPSAQGSSAAYLNMGRILEIDPIVRVRDGFAYQSVAHKPSHNRGYVRFPRKWMRDSTRTPSSWTEDDPSKAYRVKIERLRDDGYVLPPEQRRKATLTNVDRLVVVTALV